MSRWAGAALRAAGIATIVGSVAGLAVSMVAVATVGPPAVVAHGGDARSDGAPGASVGDGIPVQRALVSVRRDLGPLEQIAAEAELRSALTRWVAAQPPETCLSVSVAGSSFSPPTRFDHRSDAPLVPASALKLLTAWAALDALGPDTRLRTSVRSSVPAVDGVVDGDLYLVGSGDPYLSTSDFGQRRGPGWPTTDLGTLADRVRDAGIRRVHGAIVGDGTVFDDVAWHPAWPSRFRSLPWLGPIGGLTVDGGFTGWSTSRSVPTAPVDDPARHAAAEFRALLIDRGIGVGPARAGSTPETAQPVTSIDSAPLVTIAGAMLRESDNTAAEVLLKVLDARDDDGAGSWSTGGESLLRHLGEAGIPVQGAHIVDGSGLSYDNRLTCATLLDVVLRLAQIPGAVDGMASVGRSGTLAEHWRGSAAEGVVWAKTGTLRTTTALVGGADLDAGRAFRFALVTNAAPGTVDLEVVTRRQIELLELLLDPPPGPRLHDVLADDAAA